MKPLILGQVLDPGILQKGFGHRNQCRTSRCQHRDQIQVWLWQRLRWELPNQEPLAICALQETFSIFGTALGTEQGHSAQDYIAWSPEKREKFRLTHWFAFESLPA